MSSCLDNEKYPELHSTMGTITDIETPSIESDSYGKLLPQNPDVIKMYDADSIGQRVLVSLSFPNAEEKNKEDSGKEVTIYDFYKVLTKKANDTRNQDSEPIENFGEDIINITSAYISKEHLNIEFNINGNNETIPHRISLLLTEETKIDDEGLVYVELRHNKNSDYGNKLYWGVVSYTLSSIPEYNDTDFKGFRISYMSSDNTKSEITVKKQESNQDSAVRSMKSTQEIGYRHSLFAGQLQ
jgi:hypothetical protein